MEKLVITCASSATPNGEDALFLHVIAGLQRFPEVMLGVSYKPPIHLQMLSGQSVSILIAMCLHTSTDA